MKNMKQDKYFRINIYKNMFKEYFYMEMKNLKSLATFTRIQNY